MEGRFATPKSQPPKSNRHSRLVTRHAPMGRRTLRFLWAGAGLSLASRSVALAYRGAGGGGRAGDAGCIAEFDELVGRRFCVRGLPLLGASTLASTRRRGAGAREGARPAGAAGAI